MLAEYCKPYESSTENYEEIDFVKKSKTPKIRWWKKKKFKLRSKDQEDTDEMYGVIAVAPI